MHPDVVSTKVDQAHRDLVEHVLKGPGENGPTGGELEALVGGELGPGVQEVLAAKALAELGYQVAELRKQVVELTDRVEERESKKANTTKTKGVKANN